MACKQGIRKNIEQSKVFREEQRKPNASRDYFKDLVRRVYETKEGVSGLTESERIYFAVTVFDGEVYNGGVGQFFSNSSGDLYPTVILGLRELGATKSLALFSLAKKVLFSDSEPPTDRRARLEALPRYPEDENAPRPGWDIEMGRISKELWSDPDKLRDRLRDYAARNNLFPI
ncbi:MAG: DUF4375 domain-containing protein [Chthoniobacteraceae bacterium]